MIDRLDPIGQEREIELLRGLLPKRNRPKPLKKEREASKAERRERMASLREALVHVAHEHCESCNTPTHAAEGEAHHLESAGLRRHREELGSLVWLCKQCHRDYHRNDPEVMKRILWLRRLSVSARAAVERRLAKVEHLRRTA